MSVEVTKTQMRRGYEAFNAYFRTGDVDAFRAALGEVATPEFVDHTPTPGQGPGLEGVVQTFVMLRSAFPDAQIIVDDMVAEGEKVAARLTFQGTHRGEFMGIPPTGKEVTWSETHIGRYEDGKLVEHWGNSDDLGMMTQLGAIPAQQAPGA